MITSNFKSMLNLIGLNNTQINEIEKFISKDKVRVNASVIEFADGSYYYSEEYLKEMMARERQHGITEGRGLPVIHKIEL